MQSLPTEILQTICKHAPDDIVSLNHTCGRLRDVTGYSPLWEPCYRPYQLDDDDNHCDYDYRERFWAQMRTNCRVRRLLKSFVFDKDRGAAHEMVDDIGLRAKFVLEEKLLDPDYGSMAEVVLQEIRRRKLERDLEEVRATLDAVHLFKCVHQDYLNQEVVLPPVQSTDLLGMLQETHMASQASRRPLKAMKYLKYRSLCDIFVYCLVLQSRGYHPVPHFHPSFKWRAFVQVGTRYIDTLRCQVFTKDEFVHFSSGVGWASMETLAVGLAPSPEHQTMIRKILEGENTQVHF